MRTRLNKGFQRHSFAIAVASFICVVMAAVPVFAAEGANQGNTQDQRINELERKLEKSLSVIEKLSAKVEALEGNSLGLVPALTPAPAQGKVVSSGAVDLSPVEQVSLTQTTEDHILSNPWWKNFGIYGFGAFGYYDTGEAAARQEGTFEVKEVSFFLEADIWEGTGLFLELQTNKLGQDMLSKVHTGEAYIHFRDLEPGFLPPMGIKIGRMDIPFGEEYLWRDSPDNPLITHSAAFAYGFDEGILAYGALKGVSWVAAVTNGNYKRSRDDNSDKAYNLKFYGNPFEPLYLSVSLMQTGENKKTAMEFGGTQIVPVGTSFFPSQLGTSPSKTVTSQLVEFDATLDFDVFNQSAYLALSAGGAQIDDEAPGFERDLMWWSVEPHITLGDKWYAVARYSEIGTYDADAGYMFGGKIYAKGLLLPGYDAKKFQRLAVGLGWRPNPRMRLKVEVGQDRYEVIDISPLDPRNDERSFFGFEVAAGF